MAGYNKVQTDLQMRRNDELPYRGSPTTPAGSASPIPITASNRHPTTPHGLKRHLDFKRVNSAALAVLPALLSRWLPTGRRQGREWVALNPKRADRRLGSFRVNMATGRWSDFATGDVGGDAISLAAYLFDLKQTEAARRTAGMLGISLL
jgi:hypothetical protein